MTRSKDCVKTVRRHIWKHYGELADDARYTPQYQELCKRRKETIERVFADARKNTPCAVTFAPHNGAKVRAPLSASLAGHSIPCEAGGCVPSRSPVPAHEIFTSICDEIVGKNFMRSVMFEAHVPENDGFSFDSVICG